MTINSRQGAARNVGVDRAIGDYIIYLDADDALVDGGLPLLLNELNKTDCDLLMYDSETRNDQGRLLQSIHYKSNPTEILTGEEYLNKAEVPWVPWLTAYKRSFLIDKDIRFAEYVRFEDTDYSLKCYLLAKSVIYRPLNIVCHYVNTLSTVHIGFDSQKVSEQFMTFGRLFETITSFRETHILGIKVLKQHYEFRYKTLLKRTLWRLKANQIVNILTSYPYQLDIHDNLIFIATKHPKWYAAISQIISPILLFGIKIRNHFKR